MLSFQQFLVERNLLERDTILSISNSLLETLKTSTIKFYSLKLPEFLSKRYSEGFLALLRISKEQLNQEFLSQINLSTSKDLFIIFSKEKNKTIQEREHFNIELNSLRLFAKKAGKVHIVKSLDDNKDIFIHEIGHYFQLLKSPNSNSLPSAEAHGGYYDKYNQSSSSSLSYFFDDEELDAELFSIKNIIKNNQLHLSILLQNNKELTFENYVKNYIMKIPELIKFKDLFEFILYPDRYKDNSWKKLYKKMTDRLKKVLQFEFTLFLRKQKNPSI